ncbi:hypothetical protein ACFWCB_17545 [Streptomyces sp. NPDC060048]|uniref:hypothetical protein n=1 Tax=unclassified Streptomyces TaxID=2593676 RepID=UPI0036AE1877
MHDHESLGRLRAHAQALAGGARETSAEAVVRRVFAIQSQDATAADLGIRVRGRDVTAQAIRTAYEDERSKEVEHFMRAGAARAEATLAVVHPTASAEPFVHGLIDATAPEATFSLGTVDQLVLAAQPARHWMLRLFGLSCKTVIIDEAHAYELYQAVKPTRHPRTRGAHDVGFPRRGHPRIAGSAARR